MINTKFRRKSGDSSNIAIYPDFMLQNALFERQISTIQKSFHRVLLLYDADFKRSI